MKQEFFGNEFDLKITKKGLRIERGAVHEVFHFDDLEEYLRLFYKEPEQGKDKDLLL